MNQKRDRTKDLVTANVTVQWKDHLKERSKAHGEEQQEVHAKDHLQDQLKIRTALQAKCHARDHSNWLN